MLPTHVSSQQRRSFTRNSIGHRRTIDLLLARARVTNLGFLLLVSFAALSFLYNLSFYFSSPHSTTQKLDGNSHNPPSSILSTISHDQTLQNLIIVPGHGIWKGGNPEQRLNEDEWILEPYQKGGTRVSAFFSHISQG